MEHRSSLKPRVYFSPGDIVRVKHDLKNRPDMVVKSVDKIDTPAKGDSTALLGITCFWFDENLVLQQYRFNTKDLEKKPYD
jgi:hypothetical protein